MVWVVEGDSVSSFVRAGVVCRGGKAVKEFM